MKNKLKGGKADKRKEGSFDKRELSMGTREESEEHTKDKQIAKEIAADHLSEDPKYYSKQKKMKKGEHKNPDGSVVRYPGSEVLEKEPTMLSKKWQDLKEQLLLKAAVSNKSIMSIQDMMNGGKSDAPQDDQEQPQDDQEQPQDDQEQPQDDQDSQQPPQDEEQDSQGEDDTQAQPEDSEDQQETLPEQNAEQNAPNESVKEAVTDDELAEALKREGYSEQEIGFIIHGHHIPLSTLEMVQDHHQDQTDKALDPENDPDNREDVKSHMKNLREVELNHAKAKDPTPDLEMKRAHTQRMLDIEHAKAKAMMELELEHKKHELAARRMQMLQEAKEKPTKVTSKKGSSGAEKSK